MTEWVLDVRSPVPLRDMVATWLVSRTGRAVAESEDGTLVASACDAAGARALRRDLVARFGWQTHGTTRALAPVDWELRWREGLGVRRVGRVAIVPGWVEPPDDAGAVVVLDPETAFGSGEHGSTRAALRLLDALLRPDTTVLDLGSGSGILAIAAVKLGARRAIGIDLDPDVVAVAERNATRNGVSDRVVFIEGDAATLAPLAGPAELIVANILRPTNVALLEPIHAALLPGGYAVLGGMEAPERTPFLDALAGARFTPCSEVSEDGWWAVAASRM